MKKLLKKRILLCWTLAALLGSATCFACILAVLRSRSLLAESVTVKAVLLAAWPRLLIVMALLLLLGVGIAALISERSLKPLRQLPQELSGDSGGSYAEELQPIAEAMRGAGLRLKVQGSDLQAERDKLNTITRSMPEGLLILDIDKHIIAANDSAARQFGCTGSIVGRSLYDITDSWQLIESLDRVEPGTLRQLSVNGAEVHLLSDRVYSDGRQAGYICFLFDQTDRQRAEQMRQEFTANVSHELKTPLTSISGYAEMIETGMAKPDDIKKFAATIHTESARMLALISDIIELSELDESRIPLNFCDVDLLDVARECCESLAVAAAARGVKLEYGGPPSPVRADRDLINELCRNLCDNAIRYNVPGGSVQITAADHTLRVADTGIGIPAEHRARVFERFYRVDKSRSKKTGGTGLGLAIVKHIAEQHGATIAIAAREPHGTVVTVSFPE